MKIPSNVPPKGFYYHYKHDPKGAVNNYAYEVVGVGCHTEDDCRPEDASMVAYLPLYDNASVYRAGKFFDLRPLDMWMGTVERDGHTVLRFQAISDPEVVAELTLIKHQMYP
jgi:hypothetical protein